MQRCDAFNLPILTFVDTPGFEPGKDLEWRGMIRHGAELVHAYAAATVPRVCLVLRKAYGGAYIVMDSRGMGNDVCFAWPGAEIAVMGAQRRGADPAPASASPPSPTSTSATASGSRSRPTTTTEFCTPIVAAERGFVDEVIDPADTRARPGRRARRPRDQAGARAAAPPRQHPALTSSEAGTRCCSKARGSSSPVC